jgi:enamine deaminase RidA (YjgF/YER057c/UK114 family)
MASSAKYFQAPGPLGEYYQKTGFSHAVVLPPNAQLVIVSGQGGSDPTTMKRVTSSTADQIEATLINCENALKAAGVKEGLWAVHKVTCFLLDVSHEPILMEVWRRRYPGHRPTWMTVGTSGLCGKDMIVEVQVEAHVVP